MNSKEKFEAWLGALAGNVGSRNAQLLTGVNYAVNAGMDDDEIVERIVDASGSPPLDPGEVLHALDTARNTGTRRSGRAAHYRKPLPKIKGVVRRLADEGKLPCGDASFFELTDLSPVALPYGDGEEERRQRALAFLDRLFPAGESVFLGELDDTAVKPVEDWKATLRALPPDGWPTRISSNPLTGKEGRTKNGKPSFRCLDTVAAFRFALVEFDGLGLDDQIRFWAAIIRRKALPVAAIAFSGNKSLHALLRLDAEDASAFSAHWRRLAETFASEADPKEERCDLACRDASRLTRFPEALNRETGAVQSLVYLA